MDKQNFKTKQNPCANQKTIGCEGIVSQRGNILCNNCIETQKTLSRSNSEREITIQNEGLKSRLEQTFIETTEWFKNKIEKLQVENNTLNDKYQLTLEELDQVNKKYDHDKEEYEKLKTQYEQVCSEYENNQKEILTIYTENDILKKQNNQYQIDNERDKINLQSEIERADMARLEIENTKKELFLKQEEIQKINNNLSSVHLELSQTQNKLIQLYSEKEQINRINNENIALKDLIEKGKHEKNDLVIYNIQLEKENTKLYEMVNTGKIEYEKLFQECELYRLQIEKFKMK